MLIGENHFCVGNGDEQRTQNKVEAAPRHLSPGPPPEVNGEEVRARLRRRRCHQARA